MPVTPSVGARALRGRHRLALSDAALRRPLPRNLRRPSRLGWLGAATALGLLAPPAWADEPAADEAAARRGGTPFQLGTVTVTAPRVQLGEVGEDQVGSVVSAQEMQRFNRDNVGDALDLLPGVTLSNVTKNEKRIFVRGFDSRQVGLFIDGIPVYIPYDGLVDLNRFTTADLAAVQVAKGFSSISYGPNTLGGAINLISRKPVRAFEGDARLGFGASGERQAALNLGTRRGLWYLQAGASYIQADSFALSSDFRPTATEDGGTRNNAYRKDDKLSFKLGLTPNASDEYALSYYRQNGQKGQPPSTTASTASARYWQWPYWNKESLYFVSRSALGAHETLKLRLYRDAFDNAINMYKDASYSTLASGGTGPSVYNDKTYGGSLELESTRLERHTLRLVTHHKQDQHNKYDLSGATPGVEDFKDRLSSLGLEDNIQLSPALLLSLGAARHRLSPQRLYNSSNPGLSLPGAKSATDAQAGLFYDGLAQARLYATVARKSRLPTLSDRYSQSMSSYIENPALQPEQATHYEVGYQGAPWAGAKAEAALFYSDISNKIQTWYSSGASCTSTSKCQRRNIGQVRSSGLELGLQAPVSRHWDLGGHYTYLDQRNVSDPATRLTDVPRHKLSAQALYHPTAAVELVAWAEYNSSRWVSNTVQLAGFTVLNLKAVYRPAPDVSAEFGLNNAGDKNYFLAEGYPNPGRSWFANLRYQF